MRTRPGPGARLRSLLCVSAFALAASQGAHAGLGGTLASIGSDRAALRGAAPVITPMQSYDIHEFGTADGARIRQFVSRSGAVFAVAWSGRVQPNLAVLLGDHYPAYLAAAQTHRGSHHVLAVWTADFSLHIVRLPRGFVGDAHLPALLPPDTNVHDLR